MLECYFDDSGTHQNSKIAVWGGVIGARTDFEKLDLEWKKLLKSPLQDSEKPALSQFHLAHLMLKEEEFRNYTPTECDVVRKSFRDVIIESRLFFFACIAVVDDWKNTASDIEKRYLGDAKDLCFYGVLEKISELAMLTNTKITCHFDQGARSIVTNSIEMALNVGRANFMQHVNIQYGSVKNITGLQAADTIAYEAYGFGHHLINPGSTPENPHFIDLRTRADGMFLSLHKEEMIAFLERWHSFFGHASPSKP